MKTLVTGCAGFIGFHLCLYLLKKNKFIIGVDNLNSYYDVKIKKKRLNLLKKYKKFLFIKLDLSKKKNFRHFDKFKKNIDIIVHLAGQAGVRYSIKNPWSYIVNNQYAYVNLLEYFKSCQKLKIILYASSSSVFGNTEKKKTINRPLSVYSESKLSMENLSYVYSKFYNLKLIGMRFFTVYGPFGRPDMSIYKFTKGIIEQKKISVFNFGNHERSFTYIDDLVNNINKIIIKLKNANHPFSKVVSIGNPQSIKLMKVIKLIEKFCKIRPIIKFLPIQPGDVKSTKAKVKNEIKNFNFRFKTNIEKGIYNFVNWYKNEKI
jgi:UDP-glucuronate 4-epimerase